MALSCTKIISAPRILRGQKNGKSDMMIIGGVNFFAAKVISMRKIKKRVSFMSAECFYL
jgi:hypothetical protein